MAGEVQEWALMTIETTLVERTDSNRNVSLTELRESLGIGHEDLVATLDTLREAGKAVEESPGEWRAPYHDELPEGVGTSRAPAAPAEVAAEDDAAGVREPPHPPRRGPAAVDAPDAVRVQLPLAVAKALDKPALGGIVDAGIAEAERDGVPFVFEVTP